MKSFAVQTKDALTRDVGPGQDTRGARRAKLTGLALSAGAITLLGAGHVRLAMRTEHAGTARWIVRLLRREFAIMPGVRIHRAARLGGRTAFEIRVEGDEAGTVMQALALTPMDRSIPRQCLKSRKSRDAFLRGVFLGSGTVSDPQRGYQLEFRFTSERMARSLLRFVQAHYAPQAGVHLRKAESVVYIKDSDAIIAILAAIGAHGAILAFEDVRITKDARNRANRAANCDSGNIGKILGAAERQLEAIDAIERTIGLGALPAPLEAMARERMLHPDLSLEALGQQMDPPVGKSGVHHRLSRIDAIARSIIEENEKEKEL